MSFSTTLTWKLASVCNSSSSGSDTPHQICIRPLCADIDAGKKHPYTQDKLVKIHTEGIAVSQGLGAWHGVSPSPGEVYLQKRKKKNQAQGHRTCPFPWLCGKHLAEVFPSFH